MLKSRSAPGPVPAANVARLGHRCRRVTVLLAAIVVLSLADLAATITHLHTIGMIEANPIAALIIRTTRSVWGLAAYKCATVAVCVLLLYRIRRSVQGEAAAWCGLVILALLTIYWGHYTDSIGTDARAAVDLAQVHSDRWVTLAD